MLRAEWQFVADVKDGHAALCVVGKLGGAIVEELLVDVIHDVCRVSRLKKNREEYAAVHTMNIIPYVSIIFLAQRDRPLRLTLQVMK